MRYKTNESVAPIYRGYPVDPEYDRYVRKYLKKYPFLNKMIDYIADAKIAALRAELYQMGMYRPMGPGMFPPGLPYSGIGGPAGGYPFRAGYPMMPMMPM